MIEAFRLGAFGRSGMLWDGVDLSLGDGEVWLVTGPPSCGKTRLLRILCGERRPDAGDVVVGGESIVRGARGAAFSYRASAGLVAESFPWGDSRETRAGAPGTVGALFRLSALAAGIPARERVRREEELLALAGLADPARGQDADASPPDDPREWDLCSLSLSERARVALAAELLRNPKYLFADRIVANAGDEWSDRLGALFRALAREGRTIVVAERAIPERWQVARGGNAAASGPFAVHRLAATEPKRSELEWLPGGPGEEEGA